MEESKPLSLALKYRPKTLGHVRGHPKIVRSLQSFAANPYPHSFIFAGPAGCGKTSAAYALAADLGCIVDDNEATQQMSGFYIISSGEQTSENVREQIKRCWYGTMLGRGWRVILVNEADFTSRLAAMVWLDALERLPSRTIVIFTTNHPELFEPRFLQRSEYYDFKAEARPAGTAKPTPAEIEAQKLIDDVWRAELGRNHSPRLYDLPNIIENGHLSYRAVLTALEPLIRVQTYKPKKEPPMTIRIKLTNKKSKRSRIEEVDAASPKSALRMMRKGCPKCTVALADEEQAKPLAPKPAPPVTPQAKTAAVARKPSVPAQRSAQTLKAVTGRFNPNLLGTQNVACLCISLGGSPRRDICRAGNQRQCCNDCYRVGTPA